MARVLAGTARRLQRIVAKRAAEDEDALARDEPLLAALAAASPRARSASGPNAGERWRRLGNRVEPATWNDGPEAARRIPQHRGLSLHAAVAVPARDRRLRGRRARTGYRASGFDRIFSASNVLQDWIPSRRSRGLRRAVAWAP